MMTEVEYDAALEKVKNSNPQEPLLQALVKGYSAANAIFMAAALRRIPDRQTTQQSPANEEHIADEPILSGGNTLDSITADIRRAYNHIRRVRNGYFSASSDKDRAIVCSNVEAAWQDIIRLISRRKYFEQTGELPESEEKVKPLPTNPVDLSRRLDSIRVQISNTKKRLREMQENREDANKIKNVEASLKSLENLKSQAITMLDNMRSE